MNAYVIISIEPFIKVLNFENTLLVKVNIVNDVDVNDSPFGVTYNTEEDSNTRWLIFKYTEMNLMRLKDVAYGCENGVFWYPDTIDLTPSWVDYFDLRTKKNVSHRIEIDKSGMMIGKLDYSMENIPDVILPV